VKHTFLTRLYITSSRKTSRLDSTSCFNFVFRLSSSVLYDKKWNFCTNITSHGKAAKQNGCGGKILYRWCPNSVPHLSAKNYKCSFKFAKIIVNKSTGLFLWTQCIVICLMASSEMTILHLFWCLCSCCDSTFLKPTTRMQIGRNYVLQETWSRLLEIFPNNTVETKCVASTSCMLAWQTGSYYSDNHKDYGSLTFCKKQSFRSSFSTAN